MLQTKNIFGLDFISAENFEEIIQSLFNSGDLRQSRLLITPNVDQLVKMYRSEYSAILKLAKSANFILPDGQPIIWFSKIFSKKKLKKRLPGSDFFVRFMDGVKQNEPSLYFILPNESTGIALKTECKNLQYSVAPFLTSNDLNEIGRYADSLIPDLELQNPDFVLVGLGFPKQELIAKYILEKSKIKATVLLLGASFEFYTKTKKRAPKWMQRIGLEFLYRFLTEPLRMFKRYFIDDLVFFSLCWKEMRGKL